MKTRLTLVVVSLVLSVLIGLSLAHYGVAGVVRPAIAQSAVKLLLQPMLVAFVALRALAPGGRAASWLRRRRWSAPPQRWRRSRVSDWSASYL